IAAFNTLGGPSGTSGIINAQATFHAGAFCDIHFNNLTRDCVNGVVMQGNDIQNDVFTAWHRQNSLVVERAMQGLSDWVSLPFWDWTRGDDDEDNQPGGNGGTAPLWTNAWLGGFNTPWSLGRRFDNNASLPSSANVLAVQGVTPFDAYTTALENGIVHTGAHQWVGGTNNPLGVMAVGNSPKDPVFYFHHNMVDKLWQDWELANGGSNFALTSLPGFPGVDPNSIVDSRSIGVFYAENGLAILDKYAVANLVLPNERFIYQFVIEAGNDFVVPNGKVCDFRSCEEIILKDGFTAEAGSDFHAKIDGDCDFSTANKVDPALAYVDTFDVPPFRQEDAQQNVYKLPESASLEQTLGLNVYPNPIVDKAQIEVAAYEPTRASFTVVDALGRKIKAWEVDLTPGMNVLDFDTQALSNGIYYLQMKTSKQKLAQKLVIQH
ncbi:MAG: tyrosinase family protein, partial [Bacteroidota bacterium]